MISLWFVPTCQSLKVIKTDMFSCEESEGECSSLNVFTTADALEIQFPVQEMLRVRTLKRCLGYEGSGLTDGLISLSQE